MKQQIMADGRVAINLAGYSIFAEKKLSLDQLQDVTKNLNELNALVEKSDKDKLDEEERKRLRAIAMYLVILQVKKFLWWYQVVKNNGSNKNRYSFKSINNDRI